MKRIVVLIALGFMLWVFYQQHHVVPKTKAKKLQAQEYMKQLAMTDYDETGALKQKIEAKVWAFIPNEQMSNVADPKVIVYKPNGDIWHISAKKAFAWHPSLQSKVNQVDMYDNVMLQRDESIKYTPTTITSNEIHYFPLEDKVTSEVEVTLRQPDLYITGTGMLGYLDKNWLELLDKTTTIYDQHTIRSNQVEFDNEKGIALYKQNVTVDNQDSHLASDTLAIQRDNNNKINLLIAYGNPATYTKDGDMIAGPVLSYDVATETLHSKQSTVILQPKQEKS